MGLPDGITIGHWSDREGMTGCTVVLAPAGTVAAGEVRGGGPGTRESDLLSPASNAPGVQAIAFAGGSAYGLAAADGVVEWLRERGIGYETQRLHAFLALEWRMFGFFHLVAETDAASRLVRDIDRYPGLHWITNVSGRIPISRRMRFELGFTENFMDQMSTTDFGVHFGLAVRP